jgi:hypothetical protein
MIVELIMLMSGIGSLTLPRSDCHLHQFLVSQELDQLSHISGNFIPIRRRRAGTCQAIYDLVDRGHPIARFPDNLAGTVENIKLGCKGIED